MSPKPYSSASENNRAPILEVLRDHFFDRSRVLEIGSGTGQHAVYFAAALPELTWQASDLPEHLTGISAWLKEADLPNTPSPILFDVNGDAPGAGIFDGIYSANTLHIMSWPEIQRMFGHMNRLMTVDAKLLIYGPFNYGGRFTSESNARFDMWLKVQAPHQGVRDFEAVDALARSTGLHLLEDRAMPVNNRCLVWQRHSGRGS